MLTKRKPRTKSLKQWKALADNVYSEYIRRKNADHDGIVQCVTCASSKYWKEVDNGHYFSRNKLGTRFEDKNCHPQCKACNVFRRGNYSAYAAFMYRKYTPEEMDWLEKQSRQSPKFTRADYETMIADWKAKMSINERSKKYIKQ